MLVRPSEFKFLFIRRGDLLIRRMKGNVRMNPGHSRKVSGCKHCFGVSGYVFKIFRSKPKVAEVVRNQCSKTSSSTRTTFCFNFGVSLSSQ